MNTSTGENIRKIRESHGTSQTLLAQDARLTQAYLSQVERGRRRASLDTLKRIAHALRCKVSDLDNDLQ